MKKKKDIVTENVQRLDLIKNLDITCNDLLKAREKFMVDMRNEYGSAIGFTVFTEQLIQYWLQNYFDLEKLPLRALEETRYPAIIGKQNLDIPIVNNTDLIAGISIKAQSNTSGYLDGADFINPIIMEYKEHLWQRSDGRTGVPTFLQDMARLENLQLALPKRIQTLTIIYDKLNRKNMEWVKLFQDRFDHIVIIIQI